MKEYRYTRVVKSFDVQTREGIERRVLKEGYAVDKNGRRLHTVLHWFVELIPAASRIHKGKVNTDINMPLGGAKDD